MSVSFEWDDKFSIGYPLIDGQHRQIFALASSLDDASTMADVNKGVIALFKYVRTHFSDEENLMRNVGYPRVGEHREQHEALIAKLNSIVESTPNKILTVDEFKIFLHQWIVEHIMKHDNDFFRFMKTVS